MTEKSAADRVLELIDRMVENISLGPTDFNVTLYREWEVEVVNLAPALARQVKALEAERGWRPIETAPKDGKVLLVFQGGAACSGEWRYGRPGEPQQDVLSWRSDCCGRFSTPIGWKPLLEPPK